MTLIVFTGCATPPREYVDPRATPTAEQRAAFGTIGIAAAGLANPEKPSAPDSLSDMEKAGITAGGGAVAAGVGAVYGLACGPFAIVCVPGFALVGGVAGIAGGMAGTLPYGTEEEVNSADITLRNAMRSVDVEHRLVETVLARPSNDHGLNLRRVGYFRGTNSWKLPNIDGEIDTRILLAAPKVALVALNPEDEANPNVRLEIVVDGQIFENGREDPSFERRWHFDSEVHSYFDWANDRGTLVITEINRAVSVLGSQIAADYLGEGYQANQFSPIEGQVEKSVTAIDERKEDGRQGSAGSVAPWSSPSARSEAKSADVRKLRVAIFPFASGIHSSYIAESELTESIRRFVDQRGDMKLIYSAYDDNFNHSAVGASTSFWSESYVSKGPDTANIYRAAERLDADLVFTYFYEKRIAGWYSDDFYKFELYLFDVRQKRLYRATGDEGSVREGLESVFWQLEPGLAS
jgi:hypothetical protein